MSYSSGQILISILIYVISLMAQANERGFTRMLLDLKQHQSTPELKQQSITMGKQRALLCSQCHGEDGNSSKSTVPNLASQNPVYLLKQIQKFADGSRKNYVMNALSKNFTGQDKVNLAIFYANMKLTPIKTDAQLARQGQVIYLRKCSACHGERGLGESDYARLAGQHFQYVEATLRRFRQNAHVSSDMGTTRNNPMMEAVTKMLSDEDIKALAAYVSQLR